MAIPILKLKEKSSTKNLTGDGEDFVEETVITITIVENGYIYCEEGEHGIIRRVFEKKSDILAYLKEGL